VRCSTVYALQHHALAPCSPRLCTFTGPSPDLILPHHLLTIYLVISLPCSCVPSSSRVPCSQNETLSDAWDRYKRAAQGIATPERQAALGIDGDKAAAFERMLASIGRDLFDQGAVATVLR